MEFTSSRSCFLLEAVELRPVGGRATTAVWTTISQSSVALGRIGCLTQKVERPLLLLVKALILKWKALLSRSRQ